VGFCSLDGRLLRDDGDGELGLGRKARMEMLESRVINPRRIGSFQSRNEPLAAGLAEDVVTVVNGLPELAGRVVGDNGDSSRYHKWDAS
jgi:hypothetical protein